MASSAIVRRALLYGKSKLLHNITVDAKCHPVPSSSRKFLEKSKGLTVDNVTYDLEDSVTLAKKAEARANIRDFLHEERAPGIGEQAVRINAVETGMALDDLTEVVCSS